MPTEESPQVCSVSLPTSVAAPHCDVRSFVGYAVHKTLLPVLSAYGHAAFDNYTNYLGLLKEARENYHGSDTAEGYTSTPQDLYFPATIPTIHYLTPGFMYQEAKPGQVVEMTSFSLTCNRQAAHTAMGKSAANIPSEFLKDAKFVSKPMTATDANKTSGHGKPSAEATLSDAEASLFDEAGALVANDAADDATHVSALQPRSLQSVE